MAGRAVDEIGGAFGGGVVDGATGAALAGGDERLDARPVLERMRFPPAWPARLPIEASLGSWDGAGSWL